jgi:NAD(P)-dependent dehydrogenase (short-subunit alcohol dehydrogenase family)
MTSDGAELSGQTVMVIGGGSGMGLAIARSALDAGATVWIAGRSRARLDKAIADTGSAMDGRLRSAVVDIASEDGVQALLREAGQVDHMMVTAADIAGYQPIHALDLDAATRVIKSKLIGPLLIAKHARTAIPGNGSLTFTGGIASERPAPGGSVVAAVNGALIALTKAPALELAPVRVNALSPGWVEDTPVWDTIAGENKTTVLAQMAAKLPGGRVGRTSDIARAARFIMGAEHMTGTVLAIDGGQRLV